MSRIGFLKLHPVWVKQVAHAGRRSRPHAEEGAAAAVGCAEELRRGSAIGREEKDRSAASRLNSAAAKPRRGALGTTTPEETRKTMVDGKGE